MTLPVPLLQKQGGCFNHRVVTLVADKLDCIRQHERLLPSSFYNHNTLTTLRTPALLLMQAGDSLTDVLRVLQVVVRLTGQ